MMRWRVVWALNVAILMRSPTSWFISVLLPTLGLPTILTKPALCIEIFIRTKKRTVLSINKKDAFSCYINIFGLLYPCHGGTVVGPAIISSAVDETCAKSGEYEVVAFLQIFLKIPKYQWHAGCAGIAIALDVDEDLLHGNAHTLGHGFDNAKIGLMGHNVINVVHGKPVALYHFKTIVAHRRHGIAEDRAALLIGEVHAMVHGIVGSGEHGASGLDMKERKSFAIGAMVRVDQSDILLLRAFQHDSSCTIAEERTSSAVLIIGQRRHLVGTYDDDTLVTTTLNHVASHVESVHETAAGCRQVERESILQSQLAQYDGRRRGVNIVRSCGCHNQRVNAIRIDTGLFKQ